MNIVFLLKSVPALFVVSFGFFTFIRNKKSNVNQAFWAAMNPMTLTGKEWTSEWCSNSESDNSGYWQAALIKKS